MHSKDAYFENLHYCLLDGVGMMFCENRFFHDDLLNSLNLLNCSVDYVPYWGILVVVPNLSFRGVLLAFALLGYDFLWPHYDLTKFVFLSDLSYLEAF